MTYMHITNIQLAMHVFTLGHKNDWIQYILKFQVPSKFEM